MVEITNAVNREIARFGDIEKYASIQAIEAWLDDAEVARLRLGTHIRRLHTVRGMRIAQGDSWPGCNGWKMKCPSCGELMGDGAPYKTVKAFDMPERATEMRAGDPEPDWLEALPIAGHKFECKCGCSLDIPTKPSTAATPEETHE